MAGSKTPPPGLGEVWLLMSDLVIDHSHRREIAATLGISFSRARAVRRVARRPMSMGDLAVSLGMDPPNVTVLVDDLEKLGLARRGPHPTDRRAKLVEATPEGEEMARRADELLATPPDALATLSPDELATLRQLLRKLHS